MPSIRLTITTSFALLILSAAWALHQQRLEWAVWAALGWFAVRLLVMVWSVGRQCALRSLSWYSPVQAVHAYLALASAAAGGTMVAAALGSLVPEKELVLTTVVRIAGVLLG